MKYHFLPGMGIIRPPAESYKDCLKTKKVDIDIKMAIKQHQIYADALSSLGIKLIRLRPLEEFPDSCFVEDTVVIIDEKAIICRLKPPSRRGEEEEIAGILRGYKEIYRIKEPATLEGGDLLVTSDKVYVGRSSRINNHGIEQLRDLLGNEREIIEIDIEGALHLKSLCTFLDERTLLIREGLDFKVLFKDYHLIEVPYNEWHASNSISISGRVIIPKGSPGTMDKIKGSGYDVIEIDISEFEKGDGGVTCLSILF